MTKKWWIFEGCRSPLSLQKSGEYSHVSASSLQNSGEYSNVCASPLQQSGEYSKVLSVCVFACLFFLQTKAVNIRRSSLTHYQKVMNILRFSLSLQQSGEYSNVSASPLKVFAFRLQTSDEYSKVFSSLFQKVLNILSFSLVHYQKVVNIQRFSVSPLGF